jgi:hypothetical protein
MTVQIGQSTWATTLEMSFFEVPYSCPGLNSGRRGPTFFAKPMTPLQRSVKIKVVCTLKFVLDMDIDGDMEVGSLGGLTDLARES